MARKRKLPDGMVQRPGRKGYYADFRVRGRRVQEKLGTDFDAAKTILADLRARAEKGARGLVGNDYALAKLRERYLKRCRQERPRSVKRYEDALDHILGWLNLTKVDQLHTDLILDYREHRLATACPGTVNYEVGVLGTMLRWGVRQRLIGSNPIDGIDLLPHQKKDGRALEDDEVRRLLDSSRQPWRDIWYAYLVTGLREDELASLLFTDVDCDARELIVRGYNAKGKRERRVPIDDGLWDILQRQRAGAPGRQPVDYRGRPEIAERVRALFTRDRVFVSRCNTPLTRQGLYEAFMRCCARAGIEVATYDPDGRLVEHVDVHSLRRTFATNALVNGADPKSVQEILGHRTLKLTMQIYAKVKAGPKRQAVGKLSYAKGTTPPSHVLPLTGTANG
jgi:integrase/recombinase XerD